MRRLFKQLVIAAIFFGFWGSIGYFVLESFAKPTCFDRIRNQGEESVDCGGPCAPCEVRTLLPPTAAKTLYFRGAAPSTYDLAAQIKNRYPEWGLRRFEYAFILFDASGKEIGRVPGTSYILPAETRWIIEPKITAGSQVSRVTFEINQDRRTLDWQRLKPFSQDVKIAARNIWFRKTVPPEVGFAKLSGEVHNASSFFLDEVTIYGILYGRPFDSAQGRDRRVIAVGKTQIRTLRPQEGRAFEILWPTSFPGEVLEYEAEPHSNFLLDQNFLDKYGQ